MENMDRRKGSVEVKKKMQVVFSSKLDVAMRQALDEYATATGKSIVDILDEGLRAIIPEAIIAKYEKE